MMRYTLVTEGSDDKVLASVIDWLLTQNCVGAFSGQWANPGAMDDASRDLDIRLTQVQRYFPADIFLVHRDTDAMTWEVREAEIRNAAANSRCVTPIVVVIPVRMTEAWFLFDEIAIKRAADRANSRIRLNLPSAAEVQRRADPKQIIEESLVTASELTGRRLVQFKREFSRRKSLVASFIVDFSPLRAHLSFRRFEDDLKKIIIEKNW